MSFYEFLTRDGKPMQCVGIILVCVAFICIWKAVRRGREGGPQLLLAVGMFLLGSVIFVLGING